jgi:hypothetical protein
MRPLAEIVTLAFLSGNVMVAQPVSVGVKTGIWTADDVSGTLHPESKRYIVGPTLEVRLPLRFSFEFDALYRRLGFTGYISSIGFYGTHRERDNSWEFPMIAKYRFPGALVHPFAGVGYAPRTVHGTAIFSGCTLQGLGPYICESSPNKLNTNYPLTHGIVVSGGLGWDSHHVHVSPELRYVRWTAPFLNEFGGDGSYRYVSAQNELFVLVGLSWR